MVIALVVFWSQSIHSPILLPYTFGRWLRQNPKLNVILWTALGSILSALTIYLLKKMLALTAQQVLASHGMSISAIEGKQR